MHLSAQRAREINDYYHSLGEGLGQFTPPLVEQVDSNKPLSIALEEIAAEKIVPRYTRDADQVADDLTDDDGGADAEIFSLADVSGDDLGFASDDAVLDDEVTLPVDDEVILPVEDVAVPVEDVPAATAVAVDAADVSSNGASAPDPSTDGSTAAE